MFRILLVNIIDTDKITKNYPVGLYTLQAFLHENSPCRISVEVKDTQLENCEDIISFADQWNPNIFGLSVSSENTDMLDKFMMGLNVDRLNKRKCLLVFGKQAGTFGFKTLLKKYPRSICVRGEGELALLGLSKFIRENTPLCDIPNIAYVDANTNNIITTPRKVLDDFASLSSIDHSDVTKYVSKSGNAWLEASRGCQWNACLFCSLREFWGVRRPRREKSVETIIDELLQFSRMGIKRFSFTDEDFIGPDMNGVRRAKKIAISILKHDIKTSFHADVRAEAIWNKGDNDSERKLREETLVLLKHAGLRTVFIGIESGSSSQIRRYNKGIDVATAKKAIEVCKRLGINMALGFIILEPLVSQNEIIDSIEFIKQNQILKYISVPSNTLRIYLDERYASKIRDEELKIGRHLLSNTFSWSTLTFDIVDYKHQGVRVIAQIMDEYSSTQYDLFNAIRWFERFNSAIYGISCNKSYIYLQKASVALKELQLELMHELSLMTATELQETKSGESTLLKYVNKRTRYIVALRNEIKGNGHESTCEVILVQIDKYLWKYGPNLL